jgi:hypothetical protein
MELMGGRDLGHVLPMPARGGRGGRLFGWYNRGQRVALQVASGLTYLHGRGHRPYGPQATVSGCRLGWLARLLACACSCTLAWRLWGCLHFGTEQIA